MHEIRKKYERVAQAEWRNPITDTQSILQRASLRLHALFSTCLGGDSQNPLPSVTRPLYGRLDIMHGALCCPRTGE